MLRTWRESPSNLIPAPNAHLRVLRKLIETFDKRTDPRNNTYYWMAGEMEMNEAEEGTDCELVDRNYISITPIHYDLTHFKSIETLKEWDIKF